MEKLEEIVGYLPYELKLMYGCIMDKDNDHIEIMDAYNLKHVLKGYGTFVIKPILRPIEDLYSEETDCGIKIVHYFNFKTSVKLDCRNFPYHVMVQLFKNHFDVFDLIGRGLAIDINTLK